MNWMNFYINSLYIISMAIVISSSWMIGIYNVGVELNFSYMECWIMFFLGVIGNVLSFVCLQESRR